MGREGRQCIGEIFKNNALQVHAVACLQPEDKQAISQRILRVDEIKGVAVHSGVAEGIEGGAGAVDGATPGWGRNPWRAYIPAAFGL